ncbi:4-hydroxy-tetrahydrodipicolinate reductase [Rickettsiales bacterium]|nr:4-hydroxy-tetrahydrodipicolinate reductase [Rickettsiales bacterium]
MKIGITGINGRMGTQIAQLVYQNDITEIAFGLVDKKLGLDGQNIGEIIGIKNINLEANSDIDKLFKNSDAVIDFSAPELSILCAQKAAQYNKIFICGTTGFTEKQKQNLHEASIKTKIVYSTNMSIGVNLLMNLTEKVSKILHEDYDAEIIEMHHRYKKDAPSGTALSLGEAVAQGRGLDFGEVAKRTRDGITGERTKNEIGFASLRGGDVIGDHSVIFASDGERVELTHKASNRIIYAKGAIRAAIWASGQKNGLYSMRDVLKGF